MITPLVRDYNLIKKRTLRGRTFSANHFSSLWHSMTTAQDGVGLSVMKEITLVEIIII